MRAASSPALPRLFDSIEDFAFDFDETDEETIPRASVSGSGLRTFFDRVVAELEEKNTNLRRRR